MATEYNIAGISNYVDETHDDLIASIVLDAKSINEFQVQTGVKGKTSLNFLDTEVVFGDASECGFDAAGAVNITKRYLEPALLKVNMEFCKKDVLGHYEQHRIKMRAGQDEIAFEQEIMNHVAKRINEGVEKLIWNGDASSETSEEFDGIVTILAAEAETDETITPDVSGAATLWDAVTLIYESLSDEYSDKSVMYVTPAVYKRLVGELTSSNLFHYAPTDANPTLTLPGTDFKIVKKVGLKGGDYNVVVLQPEYTYVGVDMLNDEEVLEADYDRKPGKFWVKAEFSMATQVGFPGECRIANLTTTPSTEP